MDRQEILRKPSQLSIIFKFNIFSYRYIFITCHNLLKPMHDDWRKIYERFWTHWVNRIKERAERRMLDQIARESQNTKDKEK